MNLKCDLLVSECAFTFNLYRYSKAYGDEMSAHLHSGSPSLLGSLLYKAALEKKFVMDEAKRTLGAMVGAGCTAVEFLFILGHLAPCYISIQLFNPVVDPYSSLKAAPGINHT